MPETKPNDKPIRTISSWISLGLASAFSVLAIYHLFIGRTGNPHTVCMDFLLAVIALFFAILSASAGFYFNRKRGQRAYYVLGAFLFAAVILLLFDIRIVIMEIFDV